MTIINATPHPINVYAADAVEYRAEIRKNVIRDGAEPVRVIPPSGTLLNARMETVQAPRGPIEGIPVAVSRPVSVDEAPEEGWLIVSRLYSAAAVAVGSPALARLLVVHEPVYRVSPDGAVTPCGCLGFELVAP